MAEYTCAHCGGTFEARWSEEEANAEAEQNFGVTNASKNINMACICNDCYQAMYPWLKQQPEFRG